MRAERANRIRVFSSMLAAALMAGSTAAVMAAQPPQTIGCIIEPDVVTDVGSPVIGIINTIVNRGDWVKKGQVIATLRSDVDQAALTVAQSRAAADSEEKGALANAEFARQRRLRAEELLRKEFVSKQALDQAVAEDEIARQKLAQAREQRQIALREVALAKLRLEERTIRSPTDGIIVERYLNAGERVEEKPLVRVAKVNPLRVEAIVPSALFGTIRNGMHASIAPDMPNAAAVGATVTLVDKVLDAASGTFRVRMQLPNPNGSVPAGLRCKVEFAEGGAEKPTSAGASIVSPATTNTGSAVTKLRSSSTAAARSK
jgi:membrane fusion protein, heavy metal efflux system